MEICEMVMSQTAELRNCTILFINIEVNVDLHIDIEKISGVKKEWCKELKGLLPFILRSEEEQQADEIILG
jgi:hypothetical protein